MFFKKFNETQPNPRQTPRMPPDSVPLPIKYSQIQQLNSSKNFDSKFLIRLIYLRAGVTNTMKPHSHYQIFITVITLVIPVGWTVCLTEQTDTSVNYATNGDFQIPYLGPNTWRFTTDQLYGWSSNKIEQGTGSIYNPAWGPNTQVIEMDTNVNQMYNQTLNLPYSKFSIKISYAARNRRPLNTSGLRIWWNGQVIRDIPTSLDYNIHTQTFIVQANQGNNYLTLEGGGISDGAGMSCDNIIFNKIQSFNRVQVNGQCLCDIGYFDDRRNWSCQPCAMMDTQCKVCSYDPITVNGTNATNYQFTCSVCGEGYFSQGGACALCQVAIPGCFNCSQDGLECMGCNQTLNYFLSPDLNQTQNTSLNTSFNSSNSTCTLCSLPQCLTCTSLTTCSSCNTSTNFFLNTTSLQCQPCTLAGCLTCTNLTICQQCDNITYYFEDENATQCTLCDGALNMFIGDGGACVACGLVGCEVCGGLDRCLRCVYGVYVLNGDGLCDKCEIQGCLLCKDKHTCLTCDQPNNYTLSSPTCQKCVSCLCRPGGKISFQTVPAIVYTEQECSTRVDIEHLATFIGVASYAIMFFALISVKIVGLELFGVLQLGFFNLGDNQYVNLYLSPLLGWKYMNGYNIDLTSLTLAPTPPNITSLSYSGSFLSNLNIMLLILILQLLLSLLFTALSPKIPLFSKIHKFFLHQIFLTLFLFNSFNIAFSAGLHFKYANPGNCQYYWLSTAAAVVGLGMYGLGVGLLWGAREGEFGEFKGKFKGDWVNQFYVVISVVYRMALGLYMAISNQQTYGTLLILSISLTYILYNLINLPFADFYQNYRANLCHITQLIILLVTNYYRSMRYNDHLEIKARIFTPAKLELVMIVICVIVSGVCLAYQIYVWVRDRRRRGKRVSQSADSMHNLTQESLPIAR